MHGATVAPANQAPWRHAATYKSHCSNILSGIRSASSGRKRRHASGRAAEGQPSAPIPYARPDKVPWFCRIAPTFPFADATLSHTLQHRYNADVCHAVQAAVRGRSRGPGCQAQCRPCEGAERREQVRIRLSEVIRSVCVSDGARAGGVRRGAAFRRRYHEERIPATCPCPCRSSAAPYVVLSGY